MKTIIKGLVFLCCFFSAFFRLYAQGYIVPNGVTFFNNQDVFYTIHVMQNPTNGDYTGFFLNSLNANTFRFSVFADEGVRVFLVAPNDSISLQPILSQTWPELTYNNDYVFANESPFYLGFYTHTGFTPVNGEYSNPVFGWGKFVNFFGTLAMLDSGLEIEGGGIIAGTQTIISIPEPSILALAALGGLLLGFRRWKIDA